jgi:serine/threonine protein kinase/formylglycine-generating enzyme required for sulfatase activity
MQPERWRQMDHLFHLALEKTRAERELFLAEFCAGDADLQKEVEELLLSHEQAEEFIESPASDLAAEVLGKGQAGLKFGDKLGPYEIQSVLGIGGMGEVYLASDTRLGRQVALKLLPPRFTLDPERVRRFEKEARAASALNHPNIVTIHEVGHFNDARFIVTEFVEGQTLRQLMNEKPFTLNEALNVTIQVAVALTSAHTAGIVHRDIKPENIMLRADGYVKILDFGLAKLTEKQPSGSDPETPTLLQSHPGLLMGTVQYMSPEQARGKKVDVRTDLWSLGVVLYELLAGRVPFSGETPSHVMVSLMEDKLPSLQGEANVPGELDRIVCKALRKNPKERYSAANQFAHDLKQLKQELQREDRKGLLDAVPSVGIVNRRAPGSALVTGAATLEARSSVGFLVAKVRKHKIAGALAIVAVIAMFATAIYVYKFKRSGVAAVPSETIDSLAVLPIRSRDTNTDEITRTIISELSRFPGLRVTPLSEVLPYKYKLDAFEVGQALNVRVVLVGTLILHNDNVLIAVELLDVRDHRQLDGWVYSSPVKNIPSLQTTIVSDVSQQLRILRSYIPGKLPPKNELIAIPGGTFQMGRNDSTPNENPAHEVTVQGFEMEKFEVTNAEYGQFIKQTNYPPPDGWKDAKPPAGRESFPAANVTYDDAVAFARWRSKSDGVTYRLPTEQEWEYAARNGELNNLYPWGDTWQSGHAVRPEEYNLRSREQPVGRRPLSANRWGVQDLIGNVREWTSSRASFYKGSPRKLPAEFHDWIVMRGGSFETTSPSGTVRDWRTPDYKGPDTGFRLVKVGSNP